MTSLKPAALPTDEGKPYNAPVDLVYLSSLTMGDASLETEILGMFAAQLPIYLASLSNSENTNDRKVALHTLKGAARSVGALQLSELAQQMEEDAQAPITGVLRESARVARFIDSISG